MGLPAPVEQHDYQSCDNPDCSRFACKVYKEGYGDGRADGTCDGYAGGYADGYCDGAAGR